MSSKNRTTFAAHFLYIRIRDPNYAAVIMVITVRVSHRLLIPAAGISPVFMTANVASAAPCSFVRCIVAATVAAASSCNASRTVACIKSRKIENETVSCRVSVRLNAGMANVQTIGGEGRLKPRDMRGCGFSASLSRKVSSGLCALFSALSCFFFFFAHPPLVQWKTGMFGRVAARSIDDWFSTEGFHRRLNARSHR